MPDPEIVAENLAIARRASWVMVDLYGVEDAIKNVDETIAHYLKRQATGHTIDSIWPLQNLRAALVEIEAQRGTATGMLATTDLAGAHQAIDEVEKFDREQGLLTLDVQHRYRAQRYWVNRISA